MSGHAVRRLASSLVAFVVLAAACSDGGAGDTAEDVTRNISLPTIARGPSRISVPRVSTPRLITAEPGGVIEAAVSRAPRTLEEVTEKVDPIDLPRRVYWLDEGRDLALEIRQFVPYVPVILRLPLVYDPSATAQRLARGIKGGSDLNWPAGLSHQSDDPEVAAAASRVHEALVRTKEWSSRAVDATDLYTAMAAVFPEAGEGKGSGEPNRDTPKPRLIRAVDQIAQFTYGPFMRALLTVEEVDELLRAGLVADVTLDQVHGLALDTSTDIVGSRDLSNFTDIDGRGQAVVVIDTGVLAAHPAFAGRTVSEGCWAQDSTCPGGVASSRTAGSGEPCTFSGRCDHGTHVAGIAVGAAVPVGAAGLSTTTGVAAPDIGSPGRDDDIWSSGVAPGADLIAFRAAGQNTATGDPGFWRSDVASALTAASTEASNRSVAAVNMSLQWSTRHASTCDTEESSVTAAISTLRAQGVAVVVSTGNSSWTNGISFPSCIDDAIAVGAVDDADAIASYSNMGSGQVDLLAPGGDAATTGQILAASTAGDTTTANFEAKQGTSMAAPHVAGAFALLREQYPDASVATLESLLARTGVSVTDARSGGSETSFRIDLAAIFEAPSVPAITTSRSYPGDRWTLSAGSGATRVNTTTWTASVDLSPGSGSSVRLDDIDEVIAYVGVRNGRLTSLTTDTATDPTTGIQTGYSKTACRAIGPARAYRVDLDPYEIVLGANQVSLDVSAGTVVDGVSILVISKASSRVVGGGEVVVTEGYGVLNEESPTLAAALPSTTTLDRRPVGLHVGMADGQTAQESGLALRTSRNTRGSYITSANGFAGSDGPSWDDTTYDLSRVGLVGAPGLLGISHAGVSTLLANRDCLGMVYAALNISGRPIGVQNDTLSRLRNVSTREFSLWRWPAP